MIVLSLPDHASYRHWSPYQGGRWSWISVSAWLALLECFLDGSTATPLLHFWLSQPVRLQEQLEPFIRLPRVQPDCDPATNCHCCCTPPPPPPPFWGGNKNGTQLAIHGWIIRSAPRLMKLPNYNIDSILSFWMLLLEFLSWCANGLKSMNDE